MRGISYACLKQHGDGTIEHDFFRLPELDNLYSI
jgi:hypothetical protein